MGWVMLSHFEPIMDVSRMIDRRLHNIVTHPRHLPTNAVAELLISRIMAHQEAGGRLSERLESKAQGGHLRPEQWFTALATKSPKGSGCSYLSGYA